MARSYLRPHVSSSSSSVGLYNCLTNSIETDVTVNHIHNLFRAQVTGRFFPCALGKGAFTRPTYRFGVYDDMTAANAGVDLCHDLWDFVVEQPHIGTLPEHFSTFVAVFKEPSPTDENHFEALLWYLLCSVHAEDAKTYQWDPSTSSNPNDSTFEFSVRSKSFFVVGLHNQSSRISRKFPYAGLAFNAHAQFEHLRHIGRFNFFQNVIRANDTRIQGNINPSLANYGSDSAAKQYSGRLVERNWKCPFP